MKLITILGIVLIIGGLAALVFEEIPYTTEESEIRLGPIEAEVQQNKSLPLPKAAGVVATAAGVLLLLAGRRSNKSPS